MRRRRRKTRNKEVSSKLTLLPSSFLPFLPLSSSPLLFYPTITLPFHPSGRPPPPSVLPDTIFTCIFCHNPKSITVKIDKKDMLGHLQCGVCGQKFTMAVTCECYRLGCRFLWRVGGEREAGKSGREGGEGELSERARWSIKTRRPSE